MEFINALAKRYKVSVRLLAAVLALKPQINYTPQELVSLCSTNDLPVTLPEEDTNALLLLAASRLQGSGTEHILSKLSFLKTTRFPDSDKVWDYYTQHIFDGFVPQRLYINNKRIEFTGAEGHGTELLFSVGEKLPEQAQFNSVFDKSIFINGTLYNVTKVYIGEGDLVFLWTTP